MIYVLSGGEKLFSIIAVTYPEGSICTCSDGTKTMKAKDTSGKALFNVAVGEWTVTATDGSSTASQAISIKADGQSESVTLLYGMYLFKSGDGLSSGYSIRRLNTNNGDFSGTDAIVWATPSQTAGGNTFQFQPGVDISKYTKLCVELRCTGRYSSNITNVIIAITEEFRIDESSASWGTLGKHATKYDQYNKSRHIVSLDVSSISSSSYVTINAEGTSGEVYNVWFE